MLWSSIKFSQLMKGLENSCMYVDIGCKIFALLVTTPDTPSIPKNIIQNIIFFTKIMFVLKLIKEHYVFLMLFSYATHLHTSLIAPA